jgi:hypothetical protein
MLGNVNSLNASLLFRMMIAKILVNVKHIKPLWQTIKFYLDSFSLFDYPHRRKNGKILKFTQENISSNK